MKLLAIPAIAALCLGATACTGANQADLTGVHGKNFSKIELYVNVDGHPNIVRACIGGVAFATISRDYNSILRVPEWDSWCAR